MAIKKYKPTSNGRRNMTSSDFSEITTDKPEKSLLEPVKRKGGRNNQGRILCHQGGGQSANTVSSISNVGKMAFQDALLRSNTIQTVLQISP